MFVFVINLFLWNLKKKFIKSTGAFLFTTFGFFFFMTSIFQASFYFCSKEEGEKIKKMKGILKKEVLVVRVAEVEVECPMVHQGLEEGAEVGWVLELFRIKIKIPFKNFHVLSKPGIIQVQRIWMIKWVSIKNYKFSFLINLIAFLSPCSFSHYIFLYKFLISCILKKVTSY